ncbi:NAD(P)H-quinone oxidoreductase subunit N [Vacuolonema iberomarrocanum]|uniref:NAD(P)H-quinone oxidoreductase subunit N n=1 Tax=Vacuolonema iberomarrocanum TaxID=3454632 RepID=UPI0019F23D7B|nr:NAD(P)H-quinone oxidoreductase subunit N [filamentous cyanobacterium LEGE 07170]
MPLIITGKRFINQLEQQGALAAYVPLEGGAEGRYQRRVRAAGYGLVCLTARGLGDPASYLMQVHGVRPAHLGKKTTGRDGAVGYRYYLPPILTYRLDNLASNEKGIVLWLIEGNILSQQELAFLAALPAKEPRVKVVVEMGGDRTFTWTPLKSLVPAA